MSEEQKPAQKKMIMMILCLLLGGLGIHRFMSGHIGLGVLYLLTGGVCGIMVIVDLIKILTGSYTMADGQPLLED